MAMDFPQKFRTLFSPRPKSYKDMVELLLARGAPTKLTDDPPWATPLAWAERRGHAEVAEILRKRGAVR